MFAHDYIWPEELSYFEIININKFNSKGMLLNSRSTSHPFTNVFIKKIN